MPGRRFHGAWDILTLVPQGTICLSTDRISLSTTTCLAELEFLEISLGGMVGSPASFYPKGSRTCLCPCAQAKGMCSPGVPGSVHNVEYPWKVASGDVEIPSNWKFPLSSKLYSSPGRQLLKAANRLTLDLEHFHL
jgi:hypothetical protein